MKKTLIAALVAGSALALAPTAGADTNDAAFLQTVSTVATYPSASWMIGVGKAICTDLREGTSRDLEVARVVSLDNGGITTAEAWFILGASEGAYCPEQVW